MNCLAPGIMVVIIRTVVGLLICARTGAKYFLSAANLADWDCSRPSTRANTDLSSLDIFNIANNLTNLT
jgi:hypothetical protein